jgi:hypothetical protein
MRNMLEKQALVAQLDRAAVSLGASFWDALNKPQVTGSNPVEGNLGNPKSEFPKSESNQNVIMHSTKHALWVVESFA